MGTLSADLAAVRRQARALLSRHDHPEWFYSKEDEQLTRENCGACVLNGHDPEADPDAGPNYAGWARVFVEAGETIPARWRAAFERERASDNEAYAAALAADIKAYGVSFADA